MVRHAMPLTHLCLLLIGSTQGYQLAAMITRGNYLGAPMLGRRCGVLDCCRSAAPSMLLEALPAPVLEFGSWYMNSLDVYPIQTKIATAATLAMTGDLIAQSQEIGPYDSKRGLSFGLFDAIYRGGFQHYLFPVINDAFHGTLLLQILPSVDLGLLAALERTVANQLVVRRSPWPTRRAQGAHFARTWLAHLAGRPARLLSTLLFAHRDRPGPHGG
jgi:hypothetical protein